MQGQQNSQVVIIKASSSPQHMLFVSNDHHRNFHDDFDVRTHTSHEERSKFNLVHLYDDVYHIKSHTNPDYYVFCSNDKHRKFNNDFDVRAHKNIEPRNEWIITQVNTHVFTIQSKTNPGYFMFPADDGSNSYGQDFDVRVHASVEPRNNWHIEGFHHHNAKNQQNIHQIQENPVGKKQKKHNPDRDMVQLVEFQNGWTGKIVLRFFKKVNLSERSIRFLIKNATITCDPWGVNCPVKHTHKGEKVFLTFGKRNDNNNDFVVTEGQVLTLQFSTSTDQYTIKGLKLK